jgi:NAD(P)-dependent dehydrogenase (short-subunit alcohol dehydrogenase family)
MTAMKTLERQRILITGGSRGLGLGVVEALVARQAKVTVIARDSARLTELKARLGVSIIPGDATDPMLAESVLRNGAPIGARAQRRSYAGDGAPARTDMGIVQQELEYRR